MPRCCDWHFASSYLFLPCCEQNVHRQQTYIYHFQVSPGRRIVFCLRFHLQGYLGSFSFPWFSAKRKGLNPRRRSAVQLGSSRERLGVKRKQARLLYGLVYVGQSLSKLTDKLNPLTRVLRPKSGPSIV